jgi:two-component system, OmpR family, sensor kinase
MTLRSKLVISFTTLLLVVIAGFGVVASRSVDRILIGQIDRLLTSFQERAPRFGLGPPGLFGRPGNLVEGNTEDVLVRRDVAELWLDESGTVVLAQPSGFTDDPDPLPDISELTDDGEPTTISSVDGTMIYRALAVSGSELPGTLVIAVSLSDVQSANDALLVVLMFSGLGVLLIGGAATWFAVDRSMRPVGEMVETAEAIANGDLSRRVPMTDADTELGRLGGSLNEMLHTIEEAVDHERETQTRLQQFVADASHELRTPITAISGYAELHKRGGLDKDEEEDRAWQRIESESARMNNLVEDLITLTRLGQAQALAPEEADLVSIIRNAVADHTAIDPERPVTLTGEAELMIRADRDRLHQVFSNLLSNVRMHTPSGTAVRVDVRRVGSLARVTVEDNGPGIPDDAINRVFDRFYRADPSRSRDSGGSGLGLAIVKAIVEAHGGSIAVTSDAGLRFDIGFPLTDSPNSDEQSSPKL